MKTLTRIREWARRPASLRFVVGVLAVAMLALAGSLTATAYRTEIVAAYYTVVDRSAGYAEHLDALQWTP